jgi:hypothetical protein
MVNDYAIFEGDNFDWWFEICGLLSALLELCLLAVGVQVSGYSLFGLINALIFVEDHHWRGDLGSAFNER